jgi:hypothetical protein
VGCEEQTEGSERGRVLILELSVRHPPQQETKNRGLTRLK